MDRQLSNPTIQNDFTPVSPGENPCLQFYKEFNVIVDRVLCGYGMNRQVRRFVLDIYTIAKPGKPYALTDDFLADSRNVSRNYISKIRSKYKQWLEEINSFGTRNYKVIGIVENNFDTKTNKQKPTEYTFSQDFHAMLLQLHEQVRSRHIYKQNWLKAIEEVVKDSNTLLGQFEMPFVLRRVKRPRKPEEIIGTMLLKWKRLTAKIVDQAAEFGYRPEWIKDELKILAPGYINLAAEPRSGVRVEVKTAGKVDPLKEWALIDMADGREILGRVEFHANKDEFNEFWKRVFGYVSEHDRPPERVMSAPEFRRFDKPIMEARTYVGGDAQFDPVNQTGRNDNRELGQYALEPGIGPGLVQGEQFDAAMVQSRQRFLESRKRDIGPAARSGAVRSKSVGDLKIGGLRVDRKAGG